MCVEIGVEITPGLGLGSVAYAITLARKAFFKLGDVEDIESVEYTMARQRGVVEKKWREVKSYGRGAAMLGVAVAIKVKATRI
jgi:hypothetical protein